jgi:hypothetical protein
MKKTIVAGLAGAAIAGGALGFAAPAVADTPSCTYFNPNADNNGAGICGLPDLAGTFGNIRTNLANNFSPSAAVGNLQNNFSPSKAAQNVQNNFNPTTAANNLNTSLTKGVGSGG